MEKLSNKIVIDNNSLVNFFNYYFFDRDYNNEVYEKLKEFLFTKIQSKEIIIIDKVFEEFKYIHNYSELKALKKSMMSYIEDTFDLTEEVQGLAKKYYIPENVNYYKINGVVNKNAIDREMDEYINKNADLYLVAFCNKIKTDNPLLVTDESFRRGNKLVHKIPVICKREGIDCIDLPNSLFNHYKDELNFKLN